MQETTVVMEPSITTSTDWMIAFPLPVVGTIFLFVMFCFIVVLLLVVIVLIIRRRSKPSYSQTVSYKTPVETTGRSHYCAHCGAQIDPESNFCVSCGEASI